MSKTVENARTRCPHCGAINDVVIALPGQTLDNETITCRECGGDLGRREEIRAEAARQAKTAEECGGGPSISVKPDVVPQ